MLKGSSPEHCCWEAVGSLRKRPRVRASCFMDAALKAIAVLHLFLSLHPGCHTGSFSPSLSPSTMYFFTGGLKATRPTNYILKYAKEMDY